MKWITRERPKIDRIACPWLIKRFIDQEAQFYFTSSDMVLSKSEELDAIPFDIPNVEYTHYGDKVTFDYFLTRHGLKDPALEKIAAIVRGADTDRHHLAPEAAGLWAITLGLAYNIRDDHQLLEVGFTLYDALYSWAKGLSGTKHLDNGPYEKLLHEVYLKYIKSQQKERKPEWVKELSTTIQDHIDSQINIDLIFISNQMDLNPSYLSREFSKYFEDKNFGEYVRHARIEKSITLMENQEYTLAEIAYLTGFSDQSHFSRVFRQLKGETPLVYRKKLLKGKNGTNR